MRKIVLTLFVLLALLVTASVLTSCSKDEDAVDGPMVQDAYGHWRAEGSWLSESLILPQLLSPEQLFGTGGASGLVSERALEMNGQLGEGGSGYLVCLVYGNVPHSESMKGYFRLSLVNGANILTDAEAAELGDVTAHTTGMSASVDMNRAYGSRLTVACKEETVQGVVVIPFTLKGEGTLYASLGLNMHSDGTLKIADKVTATLGTDDANQVTVDGFSVRYLTQAAYEDGVYTEEDIVDTAAISGGDNCYAVVDLAYTVKNDNDGSGFFNVLAYIPGRGVLDVTVESAPTSRVTEIDTTGGIAVSASFAIPPTADQQKTVRLLLRLLPVSGGDAEMDIFLSADAGTTLSGTTYFNKTYNTGEPTLEYTISEDGKYYTVTGVLVDGLRSVTIPDELGDGLPVTGFAEGLFSGNKSIQYLTIGDGVTHIAAGAFQNCSELRSVTMGTGVRSIGADAFRGCERLRSSGLFISNLEAWCRIDLENEFSTPLRYSSGFFLNGERVTELVIPYGIEHIGSYAFYTEGTGAYIKKIVLPASVKTIGDYAFAGWNQYETLTLGSSLTTIGDYAFSSIIWTNESLTSVDLPDSVRSIGEGAFSYCGALAHVSLPTEIVTIGRDAFARCESLTYTEYEGGYYLGNARDPYIYLVKAKGSEITVPASTKVIAYDAFYAASTLQRIAVDADSAVYTAVDGVLYSKDGTRLLQYPQGKADVAFAIPNGVTSVEAYAFYKCGKLKSLTVGATLASIGDHAFCQSVSLSDVTLGSATAFVGAYAFAECKMLKTFDLGATASVGERAFENCVFLKSVANTERVTSFGAYAFSGCTVLEEIRLGEGLLSIPAGMLSYCNALKAVVIGDRITEIGESAFEECMQLEALTIGKGIVSIGKYAFSGCKALTTIHFNATSVTELGAKAFRYAGQGSNGIRVVIGANVIVIPAGLFYCEVALGNSSPKETPYITGVVFEQGSACTEIGDYAFYNARIESIELPGGLTHIGSHAFDKCGLNTVAIPKSVVHIGGNAFNGVKSFTYSGTAAEWSCIQKDVRWNGMTDFKVICSDTTVDEDHA